VVGLSWAWSSPWGAQTARRLTRMDGSRNLRRLCHVGIFVNDFAIEPELRVRLPGKRGTLSLRSIDAAADFVRERIGRNPNRMWVGVLYRLEAARTKEDAVEAANALRALLEVEGSLLTEHH
jgi:hypothetical protein